MKSHRHNLIHWSVIFQLRSRLPAF